MQLLRCIREGIKFREFADMEIWSNMCIKLKSSGFILSGNLEEEYLRRLVLIPGVLEDNGQFLGMYFDIDAKKFTTNSLKRLKKLVNEFYSKNKEEELNATIQAGRQKLGLP